MTQQAVTSPVALFETAAKHARKVMAAVKPGQLAKPTPCTEWNVQQLMDHLVGATAYITHMLSDQPEQVPPGNSSVERFEAGAASVLKEARRPGTLEKTVKGPMGEMPGSAALMMGLGDIVVHGWDLAKATSQDTRLDSALVQACLGFTVSPYRLPVFRASLVPLSRWHPTPVLRTGSSPPQAASPSWHRPTLRRGLAARRT